MTAGWCRDEEDAEGTRASCLLVCTSTAERAGGCGMILVGGAFTEDITEGLVYEVPVG